MKKINIPIHRHTPVRRKRSVWIIDGLYHFGGYSCNGQNIPLVTDLQRVPKKKGIGLDFAFSQDFKDAIQEAFDD